MMDIMFRPGSAYIGTATLDNKRQKVFLAVARRGNIVSFSHVCDVRRELTDYCDGTEIVKVRDADGFDYFLSARIEADIDRAFDIVRMCQST
jgi:hypothetical protein